MFAGWLSPLFPSLERVTLRLAALTPLRADEQPPTLPSSTAWKEIVQIAHTGKLLPTLAWKLDQPQSSDPTVQAYLQTWPAQAQQVLRRSYRDAWIHAERRDIFMKQLRHLLGQHQIPFVLHKGLGYIGSFYPDKVIRVMNDVDIVIHPTHQQKVRELLEQGGFQAYPMDPPHPCAQLFRRADHLFYLDVHHRVSWPHQTRIPTQHLVHRATLRSPDGDRLFGPTTQFLFHIYHMCKEQLLEKHTPLRAFMELRELYLRLPDSLPSVLARAQRWGLYRMVCCGLWLLQELYPGLLSTERVPPARTLASLTTLIHHTDDRPQACWRTLQTLARGLFLLGSIDHPSDQLAYLRQRLHIAWVTR